MKDGMIGQTFGGIVFRHEPGYVYENVIAQMLRTTGQNLFYHTMPYAGGKKIL